VVWLNINLLRNNYNRYSQSIFLYVQPQNTYTGQDSKEVTVSIVKEVERSNFGAQCHEHSYLDMLLLQALPSIKGLKVKSSSRSIHRKSNENNSLAFIPLLAVSIITQPCTSCINSFYVSFLYCQLARLHQHRLHHPPFQL
jgi:hypothetical protein